MVINQERYQVFDINNNLLVDDNITSFKDRFLMNHLNGKGLLISFDDKHYINLASKEIIYKKINSEDKNFERIKFDINKFSAYKMDMWHKICFDRELIDNNIVIYRENDISELDPEVKDLVNVINELPYVRTISSCSGHGEKYLFVTIKFQSIIVLGIIAKIIFDNFNNIFLLEQCSFIAQPETGAGFICNLHTHEVGEKAYQQAKALTEKIQQYILNDLPNDYIKIIKNTISYENNQREGSLNIDNEINILKDTFNKIPHINAMVYNINDCQLNNRVIRLVVDDIGIISDVFTMINENFNNDFLCQIDNDINNENEKNKSIHLILYFIMPKNELINKVRELNNYLLDNIVFVERNKYNNDIQHEIAILKDTLNKIRYVYVDLENKDFDNHKLIIELKFYDMLVLHFVLEILWNDFRDDFIFRTDNKVCYVSEKSERSIGVCFALEFIMPLSEIISKTRALNQILLKKNTMWKK